MITQQLNVAGYMAGKSEHGMKRNNGGLVRGEKIETGNNRYNFVSIQKRKEKNSLEL
jgi:hypothetical protein